MLAKRRLDLDGNCARSWSTRRRMYFVRSRPASAARRSMAATFFGGTRRETTCVIQICLHRQKGICQAALSDCNGQVTEGAGKIGGPDVENNKHFPRQRNFVAKPAFALLG